MTRREAYTTHDGYNMAAEVSIWVQWQVPNITDRWSSRPMMVDKSASVSPHGRLGIKILKRLQADLDGKKTTTTVCVEDLPEDMQELLQGFFGECSMEIPRHLPLKSIGLKSFPDVPLADGVIDKRGESYAEKMIGQTTPPVIVHGQIWLDGRHRVWAAKKSGESSTLAIDLEGQFDEGALQVFCEIGRLTLA